MTTHAAEALRTRGIELSWVIDAIAHATSTVADPGDPSLTRCFKAIDEAGGKILRVVYRLDGAVALIITAHFDRGAKP